mmetsp:Transcript_20859/g.27044  ORF Transcript_20859/g.27044 Transcript_20859/m.27044 type:complete len:355 (+) Transcript_20859:22-1086(+)
MGNGAAKANKGGEGGRGYFQRLQPADVGKDQYVLLVWLESGNNLPLVNVAGETNPSIRFYLEPAIEGRKKQKQDSSLKFRTTSPEWVPAERFEFIVPKVSSDDFDQEDVKLLIQVSNRNVARADTHAAFGVIRINSLDLSGKKETKKIHLSMCSDGSPCPDSSYLNLTTQLMPKIQAFDVAYDLIWEYARVAPGSTHSIPTDVDPDLGDPGKYSDETGSVFAMRFDDIAPAIPAGYEVSKSWSIESTSFNADGWQFTSLGFKSERWMDEHVQIARFCRRRWTRECRRSITETNNPLDSVRFHIAKIPVPPQIPPGTGPKKSSHNQHNAKEKRSIGLLFCGCGGPCGGSSSYDAE